jgi:hypothetical protein
MARSDVRAVFLAAVLALSAAIQWPHSAESAQAVPPPGDADMGCCVLKSESARCTFTNRKYCQVKAEQLRVSYEFHKDKSCRDAGSCPR